MAFDTPFSERFNHVLNFLYDHDDFFRSSDVYYKLQENGISIEVQSVFQEIRELHLVEVKFHPTATTNKFIHRLKDNIREEIKNLPPEKRQNLYGHFKKLPSEWMPIGLQQIQQPPVALTQSNKIEPAAETNNSADELEYSDGNTNSKRSIWEIDFLRPLFQFRKYWIARKLLKKLLKTYLKDEMGIKIYKPYLLKNFVDANPNIEIERILEAADVLAEAGHIIKHPFDFTPQIKIQATKEGERMDSIGYYNEKIRKTIGKTIGAVMLSIGTIYSAIKWLIPFLIRLLL